MIIAFAGRKQSGKTTSCEYVSKKFEESYWAKNGYIIDNSEDYTPFNIYNFADPLKKICIDILGLTEKQCYGTDENKNEIVNCKWPKTNKQMTAREVLQYVGTDVFREIQHNVWADATIRKIKRENFPLALIADCRFPNEVKSIKNAGGMVIKLHRNIYDSNHASETALDEKHYDHNHFDLIIDNSNITEDEKNDIIFKFLKQKRVLPL